jgi:outer membrane murein-binding lipoprotein Lpp
VIGKLAWLIPVLAIVLLAGCASPSAANNVLRRKNSDLRDQIDQLKREQGADRATIAALEKKAGTPPSVVQAKVQQLFTVHSIQLGRLTGTAGDGNSFLVQATPYDEQKQKLKAAGTFVVDAFDLGERDKPQIGHWTFDGAQARAAWNGEVFQYCYILKCPWQRLPAHGKITVRIAYTDLLTGRHFTDQKLVTVTPPTTQAARPTRAAATP